MKRLFFAIQLFLLSLPSFAATQEAAAEAPPIEPLGTGYIIVLAVVSIAVLAVLWKYYGRFDKEEDKADRK